MATVVSKKNRNKKTQANVIKCILSKLTKVDKAYAISNKLLWVNVIKIRERE